MNNLSNYTTAIATTTPTIIDVEATTIRPELDGTFTAVQITPGKWMDCSTETSWPSEAAARQWLDS